MPNKLSIKPRAKAILANKSVQASDSSRPIDWLGLWAISLGICAMELAATAYFAAGDKIGAAFILVGAAMLIGLVLGASARGYM
jgi:hypothetical protein